MSSFEYFLVCLMRYPGASSDPFSAGSTFSTGRSGAADLRGGSSGMNRGVSFADSSMMAGRGVGSLSPLSTFDTRGSVLEALHRAGISRWIEQTPYLVLLQDYLAAYFPSSSAQRLAASEARSGDLNASSGTAGSSSVHTEQEEARARSRELFLRLAIEYWIDVELVVRFDHHRTQHYRKLVNTTSSATQGMFVNSLCGWAPDDSLSLSAVSELFGLDPHRQELQHPSPVEVVLLDAAAFRWTLGTVQVC